MFYLINVINRLKKIAKQNDLMHGMHFLLLSVSKSLIPDNCPSKGKYYSMLSIINSKKMLPEGDAQKSLWNKKVLKQKKNFSS